MIHFTFNGGCVACSTRRQDNAVTQFFESLWPWGRLSLYEYHGYFLGGGG